MTASEQPNAGGGPTGGGPGNADDGRAGRDPGNAKTPRSPVRTSPRRYGLLLLILIASYLLSAFYTTRLILDAELAMFTAAGFIEIRGSRLRRPIASGLASAALLTSAIAAVLANHLAGDVGRGIASVWIAVLLLSIAIAIVHEVLSHGEVVAQSIYGAISTYLILGLMFAALYAAMYYLNNRTFFANGNAGHSSADFQYFSFTTLTTLGYGDFTAAFSGGRA